MVKVNIHEQFSERGLDVSTPCEFLLMLKGQGSRTKCQECNSRGAK